MKVKKSELIVIWNVLNSLNGKEYSKIFSYGIIRNKKLIKDEVESLEEAKTPSQEYLDYDRKRMLLCEKFADKNDNGHPIITKGQYVITEKLEEMKKEMKVLVEENKQILDDFEKKSQEFVKILEEEVEIDFYKMDFDVFPETIDPSLLEVLEILIKEE